MQIRMHIQIQIQMQMQIQMLIQMQMQMQMINMNKKLQLIDEKPDWLDLVAITKRHRRSPRDPRAKTFSVKRETLLRKEYILWHMPTHNIDSLVIVRPKANYFDSVTNLRWLSRGIFTIELPVINNISQKNLVTFEHVLEHKLHTILDSLISNGFGINYFLFVVCGKWKACSNFKCEDMIKEWSGFQRAFHFSVILTFVSGNAARTIMIIIIIPTSHTIIPCMNEMSQRYWRHNT